MNKLRKNVPAIIHAFIDSNDGGKVFVRKQHNVEGEKSDNVYDQPYALDNSGPLPYALHEANTTDSNLDDDEGIYEVYNHQKTSSC